MNAPVQAAVNSQLQSHLAQQAQGGAVSTKGGFQHLFFGKVDEAIKWAGFSLQNAGVLAVGGTLSFGHLKISPPPMSVFNIKGAPLKMGADFSTIGGGGSSGGGMQMA